MARANVPLTDDLGKLILRLTLAILMLFHGWAKVTKGVSGIEANLVGLGWPAWVAYGVYVGEIIAPLLILIGWYARVGGGLIVVNMIFAIVLAHRTQVFDLTRSGGWALELQGFFLITALVVVLIGPGRFAINKR